MSSASHLLPFPFLGCAQAHIIPGASQSRELNWLLFKSRKRCLHYFISLYATRNTWSTTRKSPLWPAWFRRIPGSQSHSSNLLNIQSHRQHLGSWAHYKWTIGMGNHRLLLFKKCCFCLWERQCFLNTMKVSWPVAIRGSRGPMRLSESNIFGPTCSVISLSTLHLVSGVSWRLITAVIICKYGAPA